MHALESDRVYPPHCPGVHIEGLAWTSIVLVMVVVLRMIISLNLRCLSDMCAFAGAEPEP